MDERRTDTREKIRRVALELFAEQGYEKTSLREIADRLGVTKAALYYHFKTKEAIVASLVDDYVEAINEIIEWARRQPRSAETRREILRRYSTLMADRPRTMMRFVQENQSTMKELAAGGGMHQCIETVAGLLADEDATLTERLRGWMAIVTMHAGPFITADLGGNEDERRSASLSIAEGILGLEPSVPSAPADASTPASAQSTAM